MRKKPLKSETQEIPPLLEHTFTCPFCANETTVSSLMDHIFMKRTPWREVRERVSSERSSSNEALVLKMIATSRAARGTNAWGTLLARERHENRGWKSWVQNISLAKAVVLVRIDPQPQAMKISLIGVRLFFRGQLDEICLHSVSELRTL